MKVLLTLLLVPALGVAALQAPFNFDHGSIGYTTAKPTDSITRLQSKLDAGEITLRFDPDRGYLPSLLDALNIPRTSQGLVFSRTSLQVLLISPKSPRAVYFNDALYVGSVQGSPIIEIAAIDPKLGAVFYTLDQEERSKPRFEREFLACLLCHDSTSTNQVPGLMTLSVLPDHDGNAVTQGSNTIMSDRTPFKERFGGWYVTGTHSAQRHWGNLTVSGAKDRLNLEPGANVTSLKDRFDTKYLLTPHSDLVAIMVLTHQTRMHNLMTRTRFDMEAAKDDPERIRLAVEPLVRGMLFVWEAALEGTVSGTTSFAADFAKTGPRDRQGRSLRDLDLNTRLLRYPLSYLVYSEQFDGLQPAAKKQFFRRVREVLKREDPNKDFAHLSDADRQAILEILTETKPEFAALTKD
jgi:hypothetical protein